MSRGSAFLAPVVAAALLAAGGCAAHAPAPPPGAAGERPSIAMLPLENLSGRSEFGDRYTRLVWAELGRTGQDVLV